ncbi:MAG TPA: chemotaxis protein CheB [Thermoanaerobaculia bacterium]|nr:chemotaxis protein CheB [Thermoanaerobaculia bacterium]
MSLTEVMSDPSASASKPRHVVGLAASAGGLDALIHVISALPADFAAPLLVLLHLDPHHRSWLSEILDRRAALTVEPAREGERMVAGRVYVAPPGRHLVVRPDGLLGFSDCERVHFVRPSADLLFQSLGEVCGSGAIAVVLTGTGRDGADGVLAIKRHGGTVIAQDEASSAFFSMPAAAFKTGAVDQVLPLDGIAPALVELTRVA